MWHKLFIQTVKYSFFNHIKLFVKVSMEGSSRLVIFYFHMCRQVTSEMFISKAKTLRKK